MGVGLSVLPGGVATVVGVVEDTLLTTVVEVVGCSLPPAFVGVNITGLSLVCMVNTN